MKTSYGIIILIVVIMLLAVAIYWLGNIGAGPETTENVSVVTTNKAATNTSVTDLNTTSESEVLIDPNPQGTVETNYSTVSVAVDNRGKLAFYVTDPANVNLPEQAQANNNKNDNENENMNSNEDENTNVSEEANENKNKNKNDNDNESVSNENENANKVKGNKVELSSLVLTFSKVQVHLAQTANTNTNTNTNVNNANSNSNTNTNTNQQTGQDKWEVLNIDTSKEYDLIAMKNAGGSLGLLGITDLAAGKYTQIRMYVSSAKAKTVDGQDITLDIPGQNNIIKIVRNFTIEAGQTTQLTIDFNAISSVKLAGDKYVLRPVVGKMLVNSEEVD